MPCCHCRARALGGGQDTSLPEPALHPSHDLASELRPRAFHARVSRRGRALSVLARRTRTLAAKRLAVLVAAIGVPAMAAPGAFTLPEATPAVQAAPLTVQQDAGASAPRFVPAVADLLPLAGSIAPWPAPETPQPALSVGPAARPVLAAGNATDRYRAGQCLAQAVYYEAASEGEDGMRAVAQVVLNRVSHPAWPNSVCGVVYQGSQRATGCQFTFTCDGSLARKPSAAAWMRARRVADAALGGFVFAPVGLATHYHTHAVKPYWASSLARVTDIGFHRFYRWQGPAGTRAAFASLYRGGEPLAVPGRPATAPLDAGAAPRVLPGFTPEPVMPNAPSAEPAAAALAPAQAPTVLPQSGDVRPEFANSGQWLKRP